VESHRSFVIADIPGLIEGASQGAGLGIRFLKHLTRNRILLHLVDIAPLDESDPAQAAQAIVQELQQFSPTLASRPRWLVLNKVDMVDQETLVERRNAVVAALNWQGPVYEIAAIAGTGTRALCGDLMRAIERLDEQERDDPDLAGQEQQVQAVMQQEAREQIETLRLQRAAARRAQKDADLDDDDFDHDVEVEYRH